MFQSIAGYCTHVVHADGGNGFQTRINLGGTDGKAAAATDAQYANTVTVRNEPDWRLAVVGAPAYFDRNKPPKTPHDLTGHACVNIRHRPSGAIYAWEFEKTGKAFTVKVEGQLVFNSIMHVLNAAADGIGSAYVPEELVAPYLADGRLKEVLTDWCPYFQDYHLYYPNRRQTSPAFSAFVEALRFQGRHFAFVQNGNRFIWLQ